MNRKQLVCSLILFLAPFFAFSQYFTLTPMGMKAFPVESEKDCKDYIVLEFPGKTQTELYEVAHGYIVSKFNSAKDVMSVSEPNFITVNASFAFKTQAAYLYTIEACYNYKIAFKDGKIKVNFVLLDLHVPPQRHSQNFSFGLIAKGRAFGGYGIFTKKGDVASLKAKEVIEGYANRLTRDMVNAIQDNNDW